MPKIIKTSAQNAWWLAYVQECPTCSCVFELQQADRPKFVECSDAGHKYAFQCPECKFEWVEDRGRQVDFSDVVEGLVCPECGEIHEEPDDDDGEAWKHN